MEKKCYVYGKDGYHSNKYLEDKKQKAKEV